MSGRKVSLKISRWGGQNRHLDYQISLIKNFSGLPARKAKPVQLHALDAMIMHEGRAIQDMAREEGAPGLYQVAVPLKKDLEIDRFSRPGLPKRREELQINPKILVIPHTGHSEVGAGRWITQASALCHQIKQR